MRDLHLKFSLFFFPLVKSLVQLYGLFRQQCKVHEILLVKYDFRSWNKKQNVFTQPGIRNVAHSFWNSIVMKYALLFLCIRCHVLDLLRFLGHRVFFRNSPFVNEKKRLLSYCVVSYRGRAFEWWGASVGRIKSPWPLAGWPSRASGAQRRRSQSMCILLFTYYSIIP